MTSIETALQLEQMFRYLDDLRDSGIVNMFGAAPHFASEYNITKDEARKVLALWQKTFNPNEPPKARAIAAVALGH